MHTHKNRVLIEQDKCLVLQPSLVMIIGKSPAILLQQIHYWLSCDNIGKTFENKHWIHNTYEGWAHEIKTLSVATIKRSVAILKKFELISIEKFNSNKGNRTNWYTINYSKLQDVLTQSYKDKSSENLVCNGTFNKSPEVKMIQSLDQNDTMYIQENTNKDNLNNPTKSKTLGNQIDDKFDKQPIAHQMILVWCQEINPDIKPVLNKQRARMLIAALKLKFNNSLLQWKTYCQQIASSDYLMGKIKSGFKATIDWVLKFEIIQRVRELQFGVKSKEEGHLPIKDVQKIIEKSNMSIREYKIRNIILQEFGPAVYKSWFKECKIVAKSERIEILTSSSFLKNWIQDKFNFDLNRVFSQEVVIQ